MVKKKGFDWKIAAKKLGINVLIVGLSGLVVVWQEDPKWMVLIPVLKLCINYIKHRK